MRARAQYMLHNILRHVQINALVSKCQLFEILTAITTNHRSWRLVLEEVTGNVLWAFHRDALASPAITRRGLMNNHRSPTRVLLLKYRHQRTLPWNTMATRAFVVVPQPGIARDEGGTAVADRTVTTVLDNRRPKSLLDSCPIFSTFSQDAFEPPASRTANRHSCLPDMQGVGAADRRQTLIPIGPGTSLR
jgi:hypothetical protein